MKLRLHMRLFGSLRRCKFPNQQLPNQQLPNQRQPRSLRLHFRLHLHLRRTAKKTPLMTGDVSHAACETAKMMATARCLGRFDSVPPVATLAVASSPNVCRRQQWLTTGLAAIPAAVNGAAKAFSFASSAVSQRARRCPHRPASAAAAAKRLATRSSSAPIAVPSAASGKHGRIARGRRCHWRMLTTGPAASAATSCPEALLPAQSAALAGSSRRGVARFCFGLSKSLVLETIGNGERERGPPAPAPQAGGGITARCALRVGRGAILSRHCRKSRATHSCRCIIFITSRVRFLCSKRDVLHMYKRSRRHFVIPGVCGPKAQARL